jgi:hypothetical protein
MLAKYACTLHVGCLFSVVCLHYPNLLMKFMRARLLGGFLVFGFARFLKRLKFKKCNELHQFALMSGGLAFFIFLAPLQELDETRTDNP